MPDLGNLSLSASLTLTTHPDFKSQIGSPDQTLVKALAVDCDSDQSLGLSTQHNAQDTNAAAIRVFRRSRSLVTRSRKTSTGKTLEDHVRDWVSSRVELGIPESRSSLPFLYGAKKLVDCLGCNYHVYPEEEVLCSVRGCQRVYHSKCVKERLGISNMKKFKCQQHTEDRLAMCQMHYSVT